MYSRKFINDNDIKFSDLRLNEDGCFNQCFALNTQELKSKTL